MPENLKTVEEIASTWNKPVQYSYFSYLMWQIVSPNVNRMTFIKAFIDKMIKSYTAL